MTLEQFETELRQLVYGYLAQPETVKNQNSSNACVMLATVMAQVVAATVQEKGRIQNISIGLEHYIFETAVARWHEMAEAEARRNRRT